jgi:hypothetical protein
MAGRVICVRLEMQDLKEPFQGFSGPKPDISLKCGAREYINRAKSGLYSGPIQFIALHLKPCHQRQIVNPVRKTGL